MDPARAVAIKHPTRSLRLIVFSDYRSQDLEQLTAFVASRPKPHLILYGGDDIARFRTEGRNRFEELARLSQYGLCAVAGNDDDGEVLHITGERVYPVHTAPLVLGPFAVVGMEGAPLFPPGTGQNMNLGTLLYPDSAIRKQIERWFSFSNKHLIVVSHAPPNGVLDLAGRFGSRHIGNRLLREFLGRSAFSTLCVCGHVHGQGAKSERLGDCTVVNAASHDGSRDAGRVAEIKIVAGQVKDIVWHLLEPGSRAV